MSLKFKNNGVTSDKLTGVLFKDGKTTKITTLTEIIMDGNYIWCKPFTYTTGTLPAGCTSLKCYRYSSNEPDATTGEIQNGDKVYYGDKIYFQATFHVGFNGSYAYPSPNVAYTVTNNVVGVTVADVRTSAKQYTLHISIVNPEYGKSYGARRTSSPYQGASIGDLSDGATIYYGDVIESYAEAKDDSDIRWSSLPTIYSPEVVAAGYTSFSCKNPSSSTISVDMEYTVAGSSNWKPFATNVSAGSSGYLSGLSYSTTYWIRSTWTGTQSGVYYSYYIATQTGGGTVDGDQSIMIGFNRVTNTTSRETSQASSHVEVTTQSLPKLTAPEAEFINYHQIDVYNPNDVTCTVYAVNLYSENSTGEYSYEGDNSTNIAPHTRITLNVYPKYNYHVECDVVLRTSAAYQDSDSVDCTWN